VKAALVALPLLLALHLPAGAEPPPVTVCSELPKAQALKRLQAAWNKCYAPAYGSPTPTGNHSAAVQSMGGPVSQWSVKHNARKSVGTLRMGKSVTDLLSADIDTTDSCPTQLTVHAYDDFYLKGAHRTALWLEQATPDAPEDMCH
jgi:hypothetical protein